MTPCSLFSPRLAGARGHPFKLASPIAMGGAACLVEDHLHSNRARCSRHALALAVASKPRSFKKKMPHFAATNNGHGWPSGPCASFLR
jgi:hypothetical protein